MNMGGYKNRILRVNLTERSFSEETLSNDLIHDYIGGRGFGVKLLYDDLKPGTDPLGEDNELILLNGPLAGTNAQSFGRWMAIFKSPLTSTYYKSCGGGHWAAELKYAGFDALIIEGVSERPVYLWIQDGRYQLREATYLWGLDCDDTHTLIREELKDPRIRIACIGPAGENNVNLAGIFSDRRSASRGGGGAVMGAKRLKAVAVRGRSRVELTDPEAFKLAVRRQVEACRASSTFESFSRQGTQAMVELASGTLGIYPTKNFREGVLPHWEKVEGAEYDKLRVRKTACSACMIHCGSITKVTSGKYSGAWSEGPEYESMWAFTGPIATADIGLTVAADKLCDDLGLDTISTASVIGFAYELYERGIITEKETDGLKLRYGDGGPFLKLIRQIAYRQGFGDVLSHGVREAARRIGKNAEQYAIHVKGLELPGYDPRGLKALGLNLLTANVGADHCSGYAPQEIFGTSVPRKVDRLALEGKAELTKWNQDIQAMTDTGVLCHFAVSQGMVTPELYGRLLLAATGIEDFVDPSYLWLVGERIFNLERMFNIREGFGRKDDVFPRRLTDEPLPAGGSAGQVFEAEKLLLDYYQARGWDPETGTPGESKLNELGLGFTLKQRP